MTAIFDVQSRRIPGAAVVAAEGELDLATAPVLLEEALRLISRGHDRLVIDLSAVSFLDSSGINALVRIMRSARTSGGTVAIAAPPRPVAKVFELSGLDQVLPILGTVSAAVAALDRPTLVAEVLSRTADSHGDRVTPA
jgi:anti-sigma B factor antagonist